MASPADRTSGPGQSSFRERDRSSSGGHINFRERNGSGGRNSSGGHSSFRDRHSSGNSLRDRHSSGNSLRERSSSGGRDGCRDRNSSLRDRNDSPDRVNNLNKYRLSGTTVTECETRHESGGQEVMQYVGTWVREGDSCVGSGSSGLVYLERNTSTNKLRAVKQLSRGFRWQAREMECMILVKNVN